MNQVSEEKKSNVLKTLAVVGFAVLVVLAVWLAVQIVQLIPGAFSSLASLAESLNNGERPEKEIVIETSVTMANTSESVNVGWNDLKRDGSYAFSYECVEGVSAEGRVNSEFVDLECDTLFLLPAGTTNIDLRFDSEKERFVDVNYRVVFIRDGETDPDFETNSTITVVNPTIPNGLAVNEDDDMDSDTDNETPTENDDNDDTPAVSNPTPSTPSNNNPVIGYRTVVTYKEPVSDPRGYTDLSVRYLGMGYVSSGHTLVHQNELEEGESGAFQLEVKNIGTKTSSSWSFNSKSRHTIA